jgi:tRNA G18 (ribose-2'-O)-methylase SpoU
MMAEFIHQRHKPPTVLAQPRELIVACAPMRSNVNVSRIVRAAGCCGVERVICCGQVKLEAKIARDGADTVRLECHRTLPPALAKLKGEGFRLVGLEQTTGSVSIYEYQFVRRTALVIGNERLGLTEDVLALLNDVVEIPVYGLPFAHNAATAAAIGMYEYCRQFPQG